MELHRMYGKRLGRLRPKIAPHLNPDPRILKFAKYVDARALPPLKDYRDWMKSVAPKLGVGGWGMMLNDQLGDCTCAAVGHAIQVVTGNEGVPVTPTDAQVEKMYEASGYVPGNPATDNGWLISDALDYWINTGLAGHNLANKLAIDPANALHVDLALELFGWVDIGIALPLSAQAENGIWAVPSTGLSGDGAPGSWGGHSIVVCERTPNLRRLITWGQGEWIITHNAWAAYVEECWTGFTDDWVRNGKSPDGFDKAQLLADESQL